MQNELIKVREENGKKVVSARELHEFLEIKKHMTQWIKTYIGDNNCYGFEENVDYQRIDVEVNPTNNIPVVDYALTLEMSKELAMLSKSEKGKQARKYFIECERIAKDVSQVALSNQYQELIIPIKAELDKVFNEKISELSTLASNIKDGTTKMELQGNINHRPSHKSKIRWFNIIKKQVASQEDREIVKEMILGHFGAEKWQDIPFEKNEEVLVAIIRYCKIVNNSRYANV